MSQQEHFNASVQNLLVAHGKHLHAGWRQNKERLMLALSLGLHLVLHVLLGQCWLGQTEGAMGNRVV